MVDGLVVNHIIAGGLSWLVLLSSILTVRYMTNTLDLEHRSIGRQYGYQVLILIVGLISLFLEWRRVEYTVTIGILMTLFAYLIPMVNNLRTFQLVAQATMDKKLVLHSQELFGEWQGKYRYYAYGALSLCIAITYVAFQVSYLGPIIGLMGMAVTVTITYRQYEVGVKELPDLTEDQKQRKIERFDNAESLHELDNNMYVETIRQNIDQFFQRLLPDNKSRDEKSKPVELTREETDVEVKEIDIEKEPKEEAKEPKTIEQETKGVDE